MPKGVFGGHRTGERERASAATVASSRARSRQCLMEPMGSGLAMSSREDDKKRRAQLAPAAALRAYMESPRYIQLRAYAGKMNI